MNLPASATLDDLLSTQSNWLFQKPLRLGKPSGWWGHIPFAFWVVAAARPRTLVELGTHHGVSYAAFCEAVSLAKLDCRCFAVDNWQGDAHAGYIDEAVYQDLLTFNRARYATFSELIRSDFDEAVGHFTEASIDLLHIDGFHTYEAVSHDFQHWQSRLSERAIVLFHDTNVRRNDFGVHKLFAELAQDYPHFEFLHGNGLGLIAYGKQTPEAIRHLCAAGDKSVSMLRDRFAHIGARWEGHAREQEMANSFEQQVATLEAIRVKADDQRAQAEAHVSELEQEHTLLREEHKRQTAVLDDAHTQLDDAHTQLGDAHTQLEQARRTLTTSLASAQVQAHRLAQSLLANQPVQPRASLLRRLQLLLRRGQARRNPVADVIRRSPLFDAQWYLHTYVDVAQAGIDPAFHYAAHGGAEGRDPGPWFSSRNYLQQNPDVARASINALFHFELHGRREKRGLPLPSLFNTPASEQRENLDLKAIFRQQSQKRLEEFLADGSLLQLPTCNKPILSIVLVLHNQAALTFRCLESLVSAIDQPTEILIVDNASSDQTRNLLARVHGCSVFQQTENLHFLLAANLGAAQASGRYLLFLNNDTLVKPGALHAATKVFQERNNIGAVGGKIVLLDGTLQEAGSIVWKDGSCLGYGRGRDPYETEFQFRREVDYCSGAFLMLPRALFAKLGGFDTTFAPAYYEETDLCMRLRQAGYSVIYEPEAEITHIEFGSATRSEAATQLMQANQRVFHERHAHILDQQHQTAGSCVLTARMRPPARGRILLIDDQVPLPSWGSGFPRAHELLTTLHRQGTFVTHYPMAAVHADLTEAYSVLPRELEIAEPLGCAGLVSFLHSRRDYYDAIIISRPHNMQLLYAALKHEPDLLGQTRLVYDAEAIFAQRDKLKAEVLGHTGHFADLTSELHLAKPAQTVLAVNKVEAEHFSRAGCADVRVLGHCIELQPTPAGHAERQDLLFVGRLVEDDSPNADSIRWFVAEVMPKLDRLLGSSYRLNIVGACSVKLRRSLENQRVRFHGRVEDIHQFYAQARVFIAPTRFAAGIPLKIYEAAAHGLPVVASELLVEQLAWVSEIEALAANSADNFAQACARLYSEKSLWEKLRKHALQRVQLDCSVRGFTDQVRQLLEDSLVHSSKIDRQAYAAKIDQAWGQRATGQGMNWMEHPHVRARLNSKISGNPEQESYLYLRSFLQQQGWQFPVKRAASLGCGFGPLERALVKENFAERIDGFDLAASAITEARRLAAEANMPELHYHVADMEHLQLPNAQFDLVFAYSSVHHVDDLDNLFHQVWQALRPGGVFFLHEYVGPDRFQWTEVQLEYINTFIENLPPGYNCLPDGRDRGAVRRPSIEDVIAHDPSEAIRSSEIAKTLEQYFDTVWRHELGGALLHTGLSDIAQNFSMDNPSDIALMDNFFNLEDQLMAEGKISSDFTVFMAIKT
ncbi:class I SAM-dependent methyltransferase [Nitrincola sp.]|uniref:class I SAM-dependent methyltransferase n=1 Tax=Nitrincola sp. TaxID=1926584 RepID=UPI003A950A70